MAERRGPLQSNGAALHSLTFGDDKDGLAGLGVVCVARNDAQYRVTSRCNEQEDECPGSQRTDVRDRFCWLANFNLVQGLGLVKSMMEDEDCNNQRDEERQK
jgi:hypothetical protein